MSKQILIIGAGPAGLSAAHLLSKNGFSVSVYEADPKDVGGLSKTVEHEGFSFDIGGHRFYTKAKEVSDYWHDVLKDDFIRRSRLSRIYYNGKFFKYPLELSDVLKNLTILKNASFLLSYLKVKVFPKKNIKSFEDWVISQFGTSLYNAFFKSYTEKVWGMPCHEISKDWAAQRINNLNVGQILWQFVQKTLGLKRDKDSIKSLIEEFDYPRKGPGMLWDKVRDLVIENGGSVELGRKVVGLELSEGKWRLEFSDGTHSPYGDHVISSAPLKVLLKGIKPAPSKDFQETALQYQYRDFLTVVLMFKMKDSFPDNWIYIHDPNVQVARIQNYKNWSEEMVPSPEYTSYGLEYFCQQGDDFWTKSDQELSELAIEEIKKIGLPFEQIELKTKVIRMPYAYPVYDHNHQQRAQALKKELERYPGLHLAGRNGLHRYNNQDHSIKTAMIVAENIMADKELKSPWNVNQDAQYLETEES